MTLASVATEWPATQQGLVLCGQPMRFDTSLGANHGARSPMRCGPTKRRRGTRNSEHGFRSVRSAPSASCARRDSFSFWSVTEQGENERKNDGHGHQTNQSTRKRRRRRTEGKARRRNASSAWATPRASFSPAPQPKRRRQSPWGALGGALLSKRMPYPRSSTPEMSRERAANE